MVKKILILGAFVILTFPAWKALRHPGMIATHDGEAAVFKSIEFFNALKDGDFPPRWSKRLNYGLGQPTFTFIYNLPFWLTSAFMAGGVSSVQAFKIILALSFPLGAYFSYLWLSKRFPFWPAFVGGLIYAYLPYHFVNVYARGAVGEIVAATVLPLTFWALDNSSAAVISLVTAATILSHPFYGLVFALIWWGYSGINLKKWLGITWGYVNCAFYIIPALAYKHLTFLGKLSGYFIEKKAFVSIGDIFYSAWSYSGVSAQGQTFTTTRIGAVAMVLFLGWVGMWLFHRPKPAGDDNLLKAVFFTGVAGIGIFMMTRASLFIWQLITPLQSLQFPWRMLFVVTPAVVFCGTYFCTGLFNRYGFPIFIIIVGLLILTTGDYARVNYYYNWSDPALESGGYRGTYTLLLEETPLWHSPYDEYNQLHRYEPTKTEKGDFIVKQLIWKTNYHKFEIDTPQGGILSDKTHYWPGWKVFIDGAEANLYDPDNQYSHGLLTFNVPPGKHILESRLTEPLLNKTADIISLISLLGAAGLVVLSKYGRLGKT